ncbi:MAG: 7-cyano-7-deazaguanine synthase QueC [Acidobacteriota bacterium]|jgi:7-cyano-7-deazaguanine synthase|nr:7-cyano-7-deazaguanine synthase QueC [Acidobacteriota bacterium]
MKKAVTLASGGLDSTTVIAIAIKQGFDVYALSFDYGQRHRCELDAARRVALALGVRDHVIAPVGLRVFGGSALTADIEVPKERDSGRMSAEIPITYVPARNTIFLSLALGWCEVIGAQDIFIGVNAVDYSGYPDCRPEFLEAFERLAALATKAGVEGTSRFRIHAPLMNMTKAEIIRAGIQAGVDYSITHSCYDPAPDGLACGVCDSCVLRRRGFAEAGIVDPIEYKPPYGG